MAGDREMPSRRNCRETGNSISRSLVSPHLPSVAAKRSGSALGDLWFSGRILAHGTDTPIRHARVRRISSAARLEAPGSPSFRSTSARSARIFGSRFSRRIAIASRDRSSGFALDW